MTPLLLLILSAFWSGNCVCQDNVIPVWLDWQYADFLSIEGQTQTSYRLVPFQKRIDIQFAVNGSNATHSETTPYSPTAVAALGSDKIFVMGVNVFSETVVEKWVLSTLLTPAGRRMTYASKSFVIAVSDVGPISGCDIAPDESFLLCTQWDTGDVIKLDLSTGKVTKILDDESYPDKTPFKWYRKIILLEHVSDGHVWMLGSSGSVTGEFALMFWDRDLDGVPNKVEWLNSDEYIDRGYPDPDAFQPYSDWWGSGWKRKGELEKQEPKC